MPTLEPTAVPTLEPTLEPTAMPTLEPSSLPSLAPTSPPTLEPTALPTLEPTSEPTALPTLEPTALPSLEPSAAPTLMPTAAPSGAPSFLPTLVPSSLPSMAPSPLPTGLPTLEPTAAPTLEPTPLPTGLPSPEPSSSPTTSRPTVAPRKPTAMPVLSPPVVEGLFIETPGAIVVPRGVGVVTLFNPNNKLTIRAEWTSTDSVNAILWSSDDVALAYGETTATSLSGNFLVVSPLSMSDGAATWVGGARYTLRFQATNSQGAYDFDTVTVEASELPWNGTLIASPKNGTAMTNAFNLATKHWGKKYPPDKIQTRFCLFHHLKKIAPPDFTFKLTMLNKFLPLYHK